jgi:hypothetical protein
MLIILQAINKYILVIIGVTFFKKGQSEVTFALLFSLFST